MMKMVVCYCIECDNPDLSHDENDKEDFNSIMECGGLFHLWDCAHFKAVMELGQGAFTWFTKTAIECNCSLKVD
jgi:hypothetical protein